jgi:hypothetical protein
MAIVREQPIDIAQATSSTTKRNLFEVQSSLIQSIVGFNIVSIITVVIKKARRSELFLSES